MLGKHPNSPSPHYPPCYLMRESEALRTGWPGDHGTGAEVMCPEETEYTNCFKSHSKIYKYLKRERKKKNYSVILYPNSFVSFESQFFFCHINKQFFKTYHLDHFTGL